MAEHDITSELGAIKIADEVVSIIAGLAAVQVEGVVEMSGGVAGDIADLLKRKNFSKGVKSVVGDTDTTVDIFLAVEYGVSIPSVAAEIQAKVTRAVETMTGLKVLNVNIHVQGVNIQKKEE